MKYNKKIFVLLSALVLCIAAIATLVGCDDEVCYHTYGDYVTTVEATCEQNGAKEHTCISCGYTETVEINARGHKFGSYKLDNNESCTSPGTQSADCTYEGCNETDTKNVDALALGHKYSAGVCSVCNDAMTLIEELSASADGSVKVKIYKNADGHYELDVVGSGATDDYSADALPSWDKYKNDITVLRICEGVSEIGDYAFSSFDNIEWIYVGRDLKHFGSHALADELKPDRAFIDDVRAWASIEFEEEGVPTLYLSSLLYMGDGVIQNLEIPEGTERINPYAFYKNKMLLSVSLPSSLTEIGDYAFYGCTAIEEVRIDDIASWCAVKLGTNYSNPMIYGMDLYVNDAYTVNLVIPNGVERIEGNTFEGCKSIKMVSLPDSVTEIGAQAFYNCDSLESISLNDGLKNIGDFAFFGCTALTAIEIPSTVSFISEDAIRGATAIASLTLSAQTQIAEGAFSDASAISTVIFYGTEEQWLALGIATADGASIEYK